jgi:flagellar biosynthetic protein FliP
MAMVPPTVVALPLKVGVFVLADGWTLVVRGLISSFGV